MADKPKITVHSNWYGNKYETREHNTAVYLRCCVKNDILKLSCFITEDIRTSVKKPLYEIYFSKEERTYLTYNTEKTDVEMIELPDSHDGRGVKFVQNGHVYIMRNGNIYNLLGVQIK